MPVLQITPGEAWLRMERGARYVDLRVPTEYDAGHPAGAFNLPWHDAGRGRDALNEHFLNAAQACFASDTMLLVGCAAGLCSAQAAAALNGAGFAEVVEVPAGFIGRLSPFGEIVEPGWSALGLPIEIGRSGGRSWVALRRLLNATASNEGEPQ